MPHLTTTLSVLFVTVFLAYNVGRWHGDSSRPVVKRPRENRARVLYDPAGPHGAIEFVRTF